MLAKEQIESAVASVDLNSTRLHIRRYNQSDEQVEVAQQQNAEVMRYIRPAVSEQQAKEIFIKMLEPWQAEDGNWVAISVERLSDGAIIGALSFRFESFDFEIVEIGYRFVPEYQGQGYAVEAVSLMVDWLIKDIGVHKIVAKCDPENVASVRVMEKLGMQLEAKLREHYKLAGRYTDEYVYGLLAREV